VGTEEAELDDEPMDKKIARLAQELYAEFDRGRGLEDEVRTRVGGLSFGG
jgi:type I restriction enzyme M protein